MPLCVKQYDDLSGCWWPPSFGDRTCPCHVLWHSRLVVLVCWRMPYRRQGRQEDSASSAVHNQAIALADVPQQIVQGNSQVCSCDLCASNSWGIPEDDVSISQFLQEDTCWQNQIWDLTLQCEIALRWRFFIGKVGRYELSSFANIMLSILLLMLDFCFFILIFQDTDKKLKTFNFGSKKLKSYPNRLMMFYFATCCLFTIVLLSEFTFYVLCGMTIITGIYVFV